MVSKLGLLLLCFGVVLGCGRKPATDAPPSIRLGEDTCDECRMIISDERFAASYVTAGGETYRFDDPGEMVLSLRRRSDGMIRAWVYDYETRKPIRAEEAIFVHSPALHTPMGYGVAAFATRERAEAFIQQQGGKQFTWSEIRQLPLSPAPNQKMPGHSMKQHEASGKSQSSPEAE